MTCQVLMLSQLFCKLVAAPAKAFIKYELGVSEHARVQNAGLRLTKEPLIATEQLCQSRECILRVAEDVFFDHDSRVRGLGQLVGGCLTQLVCYCELHQCIGRARRNIKLMYQASIYWVEIQLVELQACQLRGQISRGLSRQTQALRTAISSKDAYAS